MTSEPMTSTNEVFDAILDLVESSCLFTDDLEDKGVDIINKYVNSQIDLENTFSPIEEASPNTPYWLIDENLDPQRLFLGIKLFSEGQNCFYWINQATVNFKFDDEPARLISGGLGSNTEFKPTHFLNIPNFPVRKAKNGSDTKAL